MTQWHPKPKVWYVIEQFAGLGYGWHEYSPYFNTQKEANEWLDKLDPIVFSLHDTRICRVTKEEVVFMKKVSK